MKVTPQVQNFKGCHKKLSNQDKWASLIAQLVKNPPAMQETPVRFLGQEIPWRRDRLPTPVFLGFPCGSAGKESAGNAGDLGSIPGLGRYPGEGKGYPFLYSGLEKSMDHIVLGVTKSRTWLSGFHFSFSLEISSVLRPAAYHQTVTMTLFMVQAWFWEVFWSFF